MSSCARLCFKSYSTVMASILFRFFLKTHIEVVFPITRYRIAVLSFLRKQLLVKIRSQKYKMAAKIAFLQIKLFFVESIQYDQILPH